MGGLTSWGVSTRVRVPVEHCTPAAHSQGLFASTWAMQVAAELVATVHTRYVFQGLADFHFFGSRRQPISPLVAHGPHPVGVQPEPLMTAPAQFSRVDVPLDYGYKQLAIDAAGRLPFCVGRVPAVVILGLWQCAALPPRLPAMQP